VTERYVHDGGLGALAVEYAGSNTSNRYWNFTAERGSVVTQSNASGTGQFANSYDAYGVEGSSNSGHYGYVGGDPVNRVDPLRRVWGME